MGFVHWWGKKIVFKLLHSQWTWKQINTTSSWTMSTSLVLVLRTSKESQFGQAVVPRSQWITEVGGQDFHHHPWHLPVNLSVSRETKGRSQIESKTRGNDSHYQWVITNWNLHDADKEQMAEREKKASRSHVLEQRSRWRRKRKGRVLQR